ncbi:M48 family metalloprotease [Kitasatospora sp. NBC_00315]|uniref:M48 family metallopeptidase n=1 Tax=Kitasatospora sp. NBC_00315 TaxID=2975963 RepID=UPI003249294B
MIAPDIAPPRACPHCAAPLETDERFPTWCPACEWGLLPAPEAEAHRTPDDRAHAERGARREEARRRAVRVRVESLYEATADGSAPTRDRTWLAAAAIAGLVHLVTFGLLAGSVLLLCGGAWPMRILGAVGLVVTYGLRPRLGRVVRDETILRRCDAPALYALADRVSSAVGARPVDHIRVTDEFNASFGRYGLRRRSVLVLGLPLWVSLGPQERVALLGHEFGHDVNGDHRRGLWLHSAVTALVEWHHLTRPDGDGGSGAGFTIGTVNVLVGMVHGLVHRVVRALLVLLDRLTVRSGQGAEYRADALAAKVGSAAAVRGLLEVLLHPQSAETVLLRFRSMPRQGRGARSASRREDVDLWARITAQIADVPPLERERRLRLSAREFEAVDATHPPTHLRLRLLGTRPAGEPTVVLTDQEAAAIENELAPARARVVAALMAG